MSASESTQGELDFGRGDPEGYSRWQNEQANWLARLRQQVGLPIGRIVRVKLRDFNREFSGRLTLVEIPLEPRGPSHQLFRVGNFEFTAAEIESCVREG